MGSNELFQAIDAGDQERALQMLMDQPELASARDDFGLSPLTQALYHGLDALAVALREATEGDLDLFEAASVGALGRLDALLEDRSAATAWSSDGFTALHLAAFFGQPDAARLLIERGADIEAAATNRRFAGGAHPLHSAVAARDREIVGILLAAGADPNARQHGGFTPLLEAAQLGDADLAGLLLEHGADAKATLDDGGSAAALARKAGADSLAERLQEASREGD
jgi:uncharacterized protein